MKRVLPYMEYDAQDPGPQYLEDLATGYWFSEVLFTAVELDLFSRLDPGGAGPEELSSGLGMNPDALRRFLSALAALGLVTEYGGKYFNAALSGKYLVRGKKAFQGDSILWRKCLRPYWAGLGDCIRTGRKTTYGNTDDTAGQYELLRRYIRGMDSIAWTKAGEVVSCFGSIPGKGRLLDAGAGSGAFSAAFLTRHPGMHATLFDLPHVLEFTRELMSERGIVGNAAYCGGNVLESWPMPQKAFDLVLLSNIIHAYSEKELPHILAEAAGAVTDGGILLIHDFFAGHCPAKAALTDLNMLVNTYNGRVFSSSLLEGKLGGLGFRNILFVPLKTDTALLFASRSPEGLGVLETDAYDRLVPKVQALGFSRVRRMKAEDVVVADWAGLKCRFGCGRHGSPHCPPNSPDPEKTRAVLKGFHSVLLLEGEPPTREFQLKVLQAERTAYLNGFHKAFSYWSGPCSLCDACVTDGKCRNTAMARPSMEGSGIDVFATAGRAGAALRPVTDKTGFVKYFGLLLLE